MPLDPRERMLQLLHTAVPALRYQPGEDPAAWQAKARARLMELLGLPLEGEAKNFRIEWTKDEEPGFTETRFVFESEPLVEIGCHLFLPKAVQREKHPLIIFVQGHATGMHISMNRPKFDRDPRDIATGDLDMARQALARGYAALTLDQRWFGERGADENGIPACRQPAMSALMLGRTLIGERCWDVSRTIDMLAAHFPMIDMDRIGIAGNSGGGTTTIYAAALDERIAAAMPSAALSGYSISICERQHCFCNYIPRVLKSFDMGDLAAMVAPRYLCAVNGDSDPEFPSPAAREQMAVARVLYDALGAPDKVTHVIGPGGHRFFADLAWPVFDQLTGWNT